MARSMVSFIVAAMLVVTSLGLKPTAVVANRFNYKEALEKSLLFFEAQRSGKLPPDQRVNWRGDSGLKDGFDQEVKDVGSKHDEYPCGMYPQVDLVGGYYDSGDHVKFGLPMAFAVTMLSWSTIEFEKEIATANQLEYALDAIQWGTDYFMKAHKQPDALWAQVGDGDSDHYCWMRAEDMATPRTAYKVDSEHPGSDIAAETAAAMAAASIAFKPYNSSYSKLLLLHAKQLFSFADTFRGRYDDSIAVVRKYYPSSSGYHDELLWAASWLFEATDDQYYLKYVADNAVSLGGTGWAVREFSWDNKYAGLQVLLTKVLMEGDSEAYSSTLKQYQAKAEFFLCACLQKNIDYNVEMTPGGLLYFDEWNNMQYVATASFLLAVYSDILSMKHARLECPNGQVQPSELLKFAQSQADYILGKNPKSMSYLVGYQRNYPTHVHHRGASIPSIFVLPSPIGCTEGFEKWHHRQEGNPIVIVGALVGGPDRQDQFYDDRSNYEQTEPTIAANAPLVGLFARLAHEPGYSGYLPIYSTASPSKKATEEPFEFIDTVTNTWKEKDVVYYRHHVIIKNTCSKPITDLKLHIENLSGPLWGLSPTTEKNIYELSPWLQVVKPGTPFDFVYIQGGLQAKFSVVIYH